MPAGEAVSEPRVMMGSTTLSYISRFRSYRRSPTPATLRLTLSATGL